MEPYELVGRFPSMQDFDAQEQRYKANQLLQLLGQNQVDNLPVQNELLRTQLTGAQLAQKAALAKFNILAPILARLSGQQPAGSPQFAAGTTALGAQPAGAGPTVAAGNAQNALAAMTPQAAPSDPSGLGLSLGDVTALKLGGMADLLPEFKTGLEGVSIGAGTYHKGADGKVVYYVNPKDGLDVDPVTKAISVVPGAATSAATIAGATKAGETAGANSQTLLPADRLGPDGRPILATVGQAVAQAGAPNPFGGAPNPFGGGAPAPAPVAAAPQSGLVPTGALGQVPAAPFKARDGSQGATQADVLADMARTGQDPATLKINGQPAFAPSEPADMPGIRAEYAQAQAAGPAGIAAFEQKHLAQIQQLPQEKRYQALMGFGNFMRSQAAAPVTANTAPAAAAPGAQPIAFMGPAEAAADKIAKENEAKLRTQPAVDQATAEATDTGKATVAYQTELNKGVDSMFALMQRNQALKPLLEKFQTGGLLPTERNAVANTIANMGMLPEGLRAKVAGWVGSGDPAIGKAIAYSLAGEGIQNMLQTLGTSGDKPNRPEFMEMNKNKLGLESGNLPIALAMQQQEQAYRSLLAEQQAMNAAKKARTFNPDTWRADYAATRDQSLFANGTAPGGAVIAGKPAVPAPAAAPPSTMPAIDQAAIAAELKRRGH